MSPRRQRPSDSRAASFFLLLGCATVLGTVFAVGIFAGRHWPGLLPSVGRGAPARAGHDTRLGRAQGVRRELGMATSREHGPAARPALTFYQELTAPLTAAPPLPSRPKGERGPRPRPEAGSAASRNEAAKAARTPSAAGGARRFTVQVGAFRTREQAEAVRAKLASAGQDAYIAEVDGASGSRYRVRVGAFATRDEAREVAQQIATTTYVTTR